MAGCPRQGVALITSGKGMGDTVGLGVAEGSREGAAIPGVIRTMTAQE